MTNDLEKKVVDEPDYLKGWNGILCCWFPAFKTPEPETKPKKDTPVPAYTLAEGYKPYKPETTSAPSPCIIPP